MADDEVAELKRRIEALERAAEHAWLRPIALIRRFPPLEQNAAYRAGQGRPLNEKQDKANG